MSDGEQVKPVNPLVELIGEKLERVHCVPSSAPNICLGYNFIVLCFSNGKSIHLDVASVVPVIRLQEGDWEMIPAEKSDCGLPKIEGDCPPMPKVKPPREPGTPDLMQLDGAGAVEHKPGCASFNDPPRGFASSVTDCDCGANQD